MSKPSALGANKTFGLIYPAELLEKLRFDINRLIAADNSIAMKYAVFDCAADAWHLVDWVLAHANDIDHARLCGLQRKDRGSKTHAFLKRNVKALPRLPICEQLANASKHLVLNRDNEQLRGYPSVVFDPPFRPGIKQAHTITPKANIVDDARGEQFDAISLFVCAADDWERFLAKENLLDYPGMDIGDDDFARFIPENLR